MVFLVTMESNTILFFSVMKFHYLFLLFFTYSILQMTCALFIIVYKYTFLYVFYLLNCVKYSMIAFSECHSFEILLK